MDEQADRRIFAKTGEINRVQRDGNALAAWAKRLAHPTGASGCAARPIHASSGHLPCSPDCAPTTRTCAHAHWRVAAHQCIDILLSNLARAKIMMNRHAVALALATVFAPGGLVQAVPLIDPAQLIGTNPSPAQEDFNRGMDALKREDHTAAEASFRKAMGVDPKSALAYIGMAEIAGRRGQSAEVDSWLQKAMSADPRSILAQRTWARQLVLRGKYDDAAQVYKKIVAANGGDVEARLDLAGVYLAGLNNHKAAEEAYRAAAALDRNDARAPMGLARALAAQGQAQAALAAFDAATRVAPNDPQPWLYRSRFLASQLKFAEAQASLAKAVAAAPGYLPAYLDQGDLYLATNETDKAIAAYRAAIKAVKQPAMAHFRLARVFESLEKWGDAERAYLDAVASDPSMFGAYNNLAFLAATRSTNLDQALAWANKAIEIAPTAFTLYDTLGWVHRARGELAPAVKAIQKAIADNPKSAGFHYHLGVVYADMGRTVEARAALQKALKLDPNFRMAADAKSRLLTLPQR